MTQGAGQGPVEGTQGMTTGWGDAPTLRDSRLVPSDGVPAPVDPAARPPAATGPAATGSAGNATGPARPPAQTSAGPRDPHRRRPVAAAGHNPVGTAARPTADRTPHAPARGPVDTPVRDPSDYPGDYTPTVHDLPVITLPPPAPAPAVEYAAGRTGPLYVVGDVHGYLDQLRDALYKARLIDSGGHWAAGSTRLWFLGDFTDRGPDGIGVIDLVMQLSAEAAAAGGYCKALMGNHELLILGAHRFGDTPVNSAAGTASFFAAWRLNGGQPSDMERLRDHHITWMSRLDAATLTDGHLLIHSDTTAYLEYGTTIDAMNDAVTGILQRGDAGECWELFRNFTKRFAFRGEGGASAARELLDTYGGRIVVHGHSPIQYLLDEPESDDAGTGGAGHEPVVDGPHVYADDLAIAMDGGVTLDGRLLVTRLPLSS